MGLPSTYVELLCIEAKQENSNVYKFIMYLFSKLITKFYFKKTLNNGIKNNG